MTIYAYGTGRFTWRAKTPDVFTGSSDGIVFSFLADGATGYNGASGSISFGARVIGQGTIQHTSTNISFEWSAAGQRAAQAEPSFESGEASGTGLTGEVGQSAVRFASGAASGSAGRVTFPSFTSSATGTALTGEVASGLVTFGLPRTVATSSSNIVASGAAKSRWRAAGHGLAGRTATGLAKEPRWVVSGTASNYPESPSISSSISFDGSEAAGTSYQDIFTTSTSILFDCTVAAYATNSSRYATLRYTRGTYD